MFSNNLNGAYEYESERRSDERRAASESLWLRELGRRRKRSLPSPAAVLGALAMLIIVIRVF